jgi:hypothetical protein
MDIRQQLVGGMGLHELLAGIADNPGNGYVVPAGNLNQLFMKSWREADAQPFP